MVHMILSTIFSVITGAFAAVGVTIIYNELRMLKDGVGIDAIVAVFD